MEIITIVREKKMNVSAINANDSETRRNMFIKYANQFMSFRSNEDGTTEVAKPEINPEKKIDKVKGLETLTIFPKQVIEGKTIITA